MSERRRFKQSPKALGPRSRQARAWLATSEHDACERAAKAAGLTLSTWARDVLLRAAARAQAAENPLA